MIETVEALEEEKAEAYVRQAGYAWRVEERDGEPLEITCDHRFDRTTAKVENGVVISARVG